MNQTGPRLSVSTWSLHRALGETYPFAPDNRQPGMMRTYGKPQISLLDVPAKIADMGIHTLEICHFHLPGREKAFVSELKHALAESNVQLFSVLVDNGDITHPDYGERDAEWIADWIETAAELGAERARVIAGKADYSDEALLLSKVRLRALAEWGIQCGVRVTTENWFPLLERPEHLLELLDSMDGTVGLNADFGNWGGPTKYDDLTQIFPRAESCHAKCAFAAKDAPDADDYRRCLDISRETGFTGPYTLIYDGPDEDEWNGLAKERELVQPYLL